jgi:lipopolysaccharide transport system permease protein
MNRAVTTLRPTSGWVSIDVREILRFKDLLVEFAVRDVKLRYKQTLLGVAWVVLQPLMAAGIFSFVFSTVAGLRPPDGAGTYFNFAFAGLLAWNIFGSTVSKASASLLGNEYIVSKVYFPRLILPLSSVASTLVDFAVALAVMIVLMAASGSWPGAGFMLLPVWTLLLMAIALGIGLIAAALSVGYRDVQYILPILIPFVMYASPVAFDVTEHLPAQYHAMFYLVNPIASVIEAFRWSLLGSPLPASIWLAWSACFGAAVFGFGAAVFRRSERRVADVI